jgi:hypothetical protein
MAYSSPSEFWLSKLSDPVFAAAWARAGISAACPSIGSRTKRIEALESIRALTEAEYAPLNGLFADAARLGDDEGVNAMRLAAKGQIAELDAAFSGLNGPEDRALWVLVHRPEIIPTAEDYLSSDILLRRGSKYGNRYQARSKPDLELEDVAFDGLEASIRAIFEKRSWATDRLKIDPIGRPALDGASRPVIQVAIRHGQPAETQADWSGDVINPLRIRPVKDIFLLFTPETGQLDIVSERGGERLRTALADAFCADVLDQRPPDKVVRVDVDLASLLEPRSFPTEPQDGIACVRLAQLTMDSMAGFAVKLEASRAGTVWDIDAAQSVVREAPFRPRQAALEFEFLPDAPNRLPTRRLARLSSPNGAAYPRATSPQKEVMERHLRRWGIISGGDSSAV